MFRYCEAERERETERDRDRDTRTHTHTHTLYRIIEKWVGFGVAPVELIFST